MSIHRPSNREIGPWVILLASVIAMGLAILAGAKIGSQYEQHRNRVAVTERG
ncbi:hypothetical protein FHX16_006160 [Rhizobium sp. BK661]|nr:hypothetical protein [Rhizobium sp. BK661]